MKQSSLVHSIAVLLFSVVSHPRNWTQSSSTNLRAGFLLSQHCFATNTQNCYTDTQNTGVNKLLGCSCNLLKILYIFSPFGYPAWRTDFMWFPDLQQSLTASLSLFYYSSRRRSGQEVGLEHPSLEIPSNLNHSVLDIFSFCYRWCTVVLITLLALLPFMNGCMGFLMGYMIEIGILSSWIQIFQDMHLYWFRRYGTIFINNNSFILKFDYVNENTL